MQFKSHTEFQWKNVGKNEDQIEMDLDIQLSDFLQSSDIAKELQQNRERIRQDILNIIEKQIVKKLAVEQGESIVIPPNTMTHSRVKTSTDSDFHNRADGLVADNRIHIMATMTSDNPLSPLSSMYAGAEAIATYATDSIMKNLNKTYLEGQSS